MSLVGFKPIASSNALHLLATGSGEGEVMSRREGGREGRRGGAVHEERGGLVVTTG